MKKYTLTPREANHPFLLIVLLWCGVGKAFENLLQLLQSVLNPHTLTVGDSFAHKIG